MAFFVLCVYWIIVLKVRGKFRYFDYSNSKPLQHLLRSFTKGNWSVFQTDSCIQTYSKQRISIKPPVQRTQYSQAVQNIVSIIESTVITTLKNRYLRSVCDSCLIFKVMISLESLPFKIELLTVYKKI